MTLSSDGRYVAYSANSISNPDHRYIYILASDGSAETALVELQGCTRIRSGRRMESTDSRGRIGYSRLDLDSGKFAEAVPPAPGFTQTGVLSPDGTVYIPKNGEQDMVELIAFDIASRSETVLAKHQSRGTRLSISPNGRQHVADVDADRGAGDLVQLVDAGVEITQAVHVRTMRKLRSASCCCRCLSSYRFTHQTMAYVSDSGLRSNASGHPPDPISATRTKPSRLAVG